MKKAFPERLQQFLVQCLVMFWMEVFSNSSIDIECITEDIRLSFEVLEELEKSYNKNDMVSFLKTVRKWSLEQSKSLIKDPNNVEILVDGSHWLSQAAYRANRNTKNTGQFSLKDAKDIQLAVWNHMGKLYPQPMTLGELLQKKLNEG